MNKIGSSETIRETTFNFIDQTSLRDVQQKIVSHKTFIKTSFLEWFIGFSEGDGNFIVSKERLFFIINQKEEKVLYYIRANLGFGKVSKYCNYSRYIVADRSSVDRLISIFNGNLVLSKTNAFFVLWLQARNQYSTKEICYRGINKFATFHENGWLSGFTDAEGCFNAQKLKDTRYTPSFRIRCRFILYQKGEYCIFEKVRSFLESGSITKKTLSPTILNRKRDKNIPNTCQECVTNPDYTDFSKICNNTFLKKNDTLVTRLKAGDKSKICIECLLTNPRFDPKQSQESFIDQESIYRFTSTHIESHDTLIRYFKKYPLRTIKKVSLIRFTSLCYYIKNRKTLPWQGKVLLRIENLVRNLNNYKS